MNVILKAIWREDDAVLSFEWVLLVSLLTIGIVAGLAGARDAVIDELSDIAEAAISFDQSYTIAEFTTALITAGGFSYTDDTTADLAAFSSCDRTASPLGQTASDDDPS
jgi:Flp pilus assembly pilin Flp